MAVIMPLVTMVFLSSSNLRSNSSLNMPVFILTEGFRYLYYVGSSFGNYCCICCKMEGSRGGSLRASSISSLIASFPSYGTSTESFCTIFLSFVESYASIFTLLQVLILQISHQNLLKWTMMKWSYDDEVDKSFFKIQRLGQSVRLRVVFRHHWVVPTVSRRRRSAVERRIELIMLQTIKYRSIWLNNNCSSRTQKQNKQNNSM